MALKYVDDGYEDAHQMDIEDYYNEDVKPNLFAVSRVFAEARKQMNLAEYKTLTLALSRISWQNPCPDTLYIDKKELAKVIGITSDTDHLSVDLNRAIGEMPAHSFLRFADRDKDMYVNGNFVRTIAMFKNRVRIRLEEEFLGLFGGLDKNYITMWAEDIFQMRSERAVLFYELLREHTDSRLDINSGTVSVQKFKEMFNIPKDGPGSYTRDNGHFNRSEFEKYVIDPVCEDVSKCRMIQLVIQPNGKYYEKIKQGNRVRAYQFAWVYTSHPAVATASEVKEIQDRVDKNPQLLKVARDIIEGEKHPKREHKQTKNQFNDFQQRSYDADELEHLLLTTSVKL